MSESNSVKVSIGNRSYPIRVSKDEESKVVHAAQAINKRLKELEVNYAVKDKQDLLSMCVLQYAEQVENLKTLIDDYLTSQEISS
jgi:cell division protein ZapA (FtsZ GTPase activity inhibitor)